MAAHTIVHTLMRIDRRLHQRGEPPLTPQEHELIEDLQDCGPNTDTHLVDVICLARFYADEP